MRAEARIKDTVSLVPILYALSLLMLGAFFVFIIPALLKNIGLEVYAVYFPHIGLVIAALSIGLCAWYLQIKNQQYYLEIKELQDQQDKITHIIEKFRDGNYSFDFQQNGESVILSLQQLKTQLLELKKQDERRLKTTEGMEEFSDLLRTYREIEPLTTELIKRLCRYLGAEQGVIFIIEQDYQDERTVTISGSYVSEEVHTIRQELLKGEGLVGQVIKDKKTVVLPNVPQGYLQVRSGLGEATPTNLLLVPLIFEANIHGVIEIASFNSFTTYEIDFLNELAYKVAATIFNLKTVEATSRMLNDAQKLAADLSAREKQLTQANETMRQAQSALEVSRSRIKKMTENVPDVIFQLKLTKSGSLLFLFVSARVDDMLGLLPEELLEDFTTLKIHAEDSANFMVELLQSLETSENFEWEGRLYSLNDNEYRWIRATATPSPTLEDGSVVWDGIFSDVTEKRLQEENLRLRDRAITSSSSSITIVDCNVPDLPIIYANPAFEEITGYSLHEIIGRNCRFLQNDDRNQEGIETIRKALKAGDECRVLLRNYRKNGELFWNDLSIAPVRDDKGKITHFVGISNDVTQRVEAENQVRALNENLEQRVAERTNELVAAMEELRTAQHRVVQSEKMASLGQLVAGVAHEINTPLAAVKAAVENMNDFLPRTMADLPNLMARMTPDIQSVFHELITASMGYHEPLTTRDERRYRNEIQNILDENGVDNSKDIAKKLVSAGITNEIERFLPLLTHESAKDFIQAAYHLAQIKSNMDVIQHAVDKTRKTVYALKRYSHFQPEEVMEAVDLKDSLEIILTLYHNQLKHGVTVIRNFAEVPPIPGFGDELGQVWTNIIHNAAQAMEYNGTLKLELLAETDFAVVKITDSGPGIPAEIVSRIFEPFFTTKPQGEGTGLGLDICRKIIMERHKGTIAVDTEPGRTTFIIRLPFTQPEVGTESITNISLN